MKCVNCEKPALWVWSPGHTDDLAYCEHCLPKFLYPIRKAGLLQTTDEYAAIASSLAEQLPAPTVRKKRTPKVEETVDENQEDAS